MRKEFKILNLAVTFDPLNEWPDILPNDIAESCGFIPRWFGSFADRHTSEPPPIPVKDWMEECYGFGNLHAMTINTNDVRSGSTIEKDGTHRYPGDPDLKPLIMMTATNGAQLIQWQSGIVAFRDNKEEPWFLTRMD